MKEYSYYTQPILHGEKENPPITGPDSR